MASTFSLSTLGELRLVGPSGAVLPGRRKELVLLAYLARRAPKPVLRDELAALLWGERDEDKARQSLRHALHQLRRALGNAIDATGDSVAILGDALTLDATTLELDVAAGRWEDGVRRWGGDFLRGAEDAGGEEYVAWLERERESLRRTVASGFAKLVDRAGDAGRLDEQEQWARRWSNAFPLDESACVALIAALRRADKVVEARAEHASFTSRLKAELDVPPSLELVRLGEELNRTERRERGRRTRTGAITSPDLVGRGASILPALSELWSQVRRESCMVLVEGTAGLGKTRLVNELARRIRDGEERALVIEAGAQEADRGEEWATLRRLMHALVHSRAIEDAPNKALVELSAVLPELRERFPTLAEPSDAPARAEPALRDVLRVVAGRAPVALILDDHDESDDRTHSIIRALAANLPPGILLVVTLDTELGDGLQRASELGAISGVRRFKLAPLSGVEIAAMVDSMLDLDANDRSAVLDRVFGEAGGNPGITARLVSDLTSDGLELSDAGTWRLASAPADPGQSRSPSSSNARLRRRWLGAGLLAAASLAVIVPKLLDDTPSSDAAVADGGPPRVAVLDLELVGNDTADAYLASGLAEEINSALSRFEELRIKSRGSVRTARATGVIDPIKLGQSLHVDYLVEGSVRRSDTSSKVAVRLTKTSDGFQVWSKDFDASESSLPTLHDRVAREVAARIGVRLARDERASTRRLPTNDARAYEHYLRGNYYLGKRTPPTVEQAIAQYQLALARDSAFVAARARISYGYALMLDWGWPYQRKSPEALFQEGLRLAGEAIELDSLSTDAWMAKAYLLTTADPVRMSGASAAFQRAIALDPKNTEAIHQYAQVHEAIGNWDEAMKAFERTLALEPDRALPFVAMASIEWKRGRPREARRLYDSALVAAPGASYVLSARALLRIYEGDVPGGLEDAETAVHVEDGYSIPPHSVLAVALARSGSTARARLEVERAVSEIPDPSAPSPTDARFIASALMALGRREDAIRLLERARPRGAWLWFYCLAPDFDPVRKDPRFVRVMSEAHPADLPQPTR